MLALDIGQLIAHHVEEIRIRVEHIAVDVEFHHRLRLANRADLAFIFGIAHLGARDIGGELDDFIGFAVGVENRIVGSADPHFVAIPGDALVLALVEFATRQLGPELAVLRRLDILGVTEHGVMLALYLVQGVPDYVQEIVVGVQDGAVELEFDHRLHPVDGSVDRL